AGGGGGPGRAGAGTGGIRRRVWRAARLRLVFPQATPVRHTDTRPRTGVAVRDDLRGHRTVLRPRPHPTGSGAFRPSGRDARRRAVHPVLAGAAALQFVVRAAAILTGPRCVAQASHSSVLPQRLRPKVRPSGSDTQLPPPSTCASSNRTCRPQAGLAQNGAPRSRSRCTFNTSSAVRG